MNNYLFQCIEDKQQGKHLFIYTKFFFTIGYFLPLTSIQNITIIYSDFYSFYVLKILASNILQILRISAYCDAAYIRMKAAL